MYYDNKTLIYSPSDLIQFAGSPFASWMQRKYLEEPGSVQPDEDDPQLKILQKKGYEHEKTYHEKLLVDGYDICEISLENKQEQTPRDKIYDYVFEQTLKALEKGRQVIYQARLKGAGIAGYADFIMREESKNSVISYSVWDTKLARRVKPYFLLQLCCYADMLEEMTTQRPEIIGIILGTGDRCAFRVTDFFYYYKQIKSRFLRFMDSFSLQDPPMPDPSADHGAWTSHAEKILIDTDHLAQVANIAKGQILKLNKAGIGTMTQLATTKVTRVNKMDDDVLARLKEQAQLQVISATREQPLYKVLQPPQENPSLGLSALPPESPMDIFFDMEGYPLGDDCLEYLFGAVYIKNGSPVFKDWWAHDEREEKEAFGTFIDWVVERWWADPSMHVYHYASYEQTALKRLMSKYGTREEHVDNLLRNNVFVDLYKVVRHGVRVGEPRYSIKNLEHLYMEKREGNVVDAGASIVYYDAWIESGQPKEWKRSNFLTSIRDYNEDDCRSTWLLAKWLRDKQSESGISWVQTTQEGESGEERTVSERVLERQQLAHTLLGEIPDDPRERQKSAERWRIHELLAWLLDFHRRCEKSMWWEMFERFDKTEHELFEDMDCLAGIRLVGTPTEEKRSLLFHYQFDPEQETKMAEGSTVKFVPDRGITATVSSFSREGELTVKIGRQQLKKLEMASLPGRTSIIPFEWISADVITSAIFSVVESYHETGKLPDALADFLYRRPPRLKSGTGGPLVRQNEDTTQAAIRIAEDLSSSCLCIQGPPGTGKTYTAALIIAALLSRGKSVGITSNSHKAILNLMRAVCKQSTAKFTGIKVGGEDDPFFEEFSSIKHVKVSSDASREYHSGLIGGTSWFFCRDDMEGKLDYLFVDEAGQVSVANLAGMSRATGNIILLGDQMQLGQPVQGVHPGESGQSILEYYLQKHATIPQEQGIFLETTWRMHPEICSFISHAIYESRLKSKPHTENRIVKIPEGGGNIVTVEAGLLFVGVEHEGNVQGSDEEVEVICRIVSELTGRTMTDIEGKPQGQVKIDRDILFVTPYNLQVRNLVQALPKGARVASVDKFQGQEAPIVIISMCASPGEFGSRGMEFIFDRNRLNVAISRAQSLAIVVGAQGLGVTNCSTISNMERLNLYSWIQDVGGMHSPSEGE